MGQIFGELGPPSDFSPIVSICLLLSRRDEVTHFILCDPTEEEEESREYALVCGHRYVDCGRYLCGGKESVGDVAVGAECRHVVAVTMR